MAALIAEQRPVARQRHLCNDCDGVITPGSTYIRQAVTFDGSIYTWKEHPMCQDIYWALHREGGLCEDDVVSVQEVQDVIAMLFVFMAGGGL